MRTRDRLRLRTLYVFRCGYCGISETEAGAQLTVDHWQPQARGGSDEFDNLVYACHTCNEFKGDWWEPEAEGRLLHPMHDELEEHVVEEADGRLVGRTEAGAFHIRRLRLNRSGLVARRMERRMRLEADAGIVRIEHYLEGLSERVEAWMRQAPGERSGGEGNG